MEQGRKRLLFVYAPTNQTHSSYVLCSGPRMGLSPSCSPVEEADLDFMPNWTQPRGQGATEGGLCLPREIKRALSCILLVLHTQAHHIHLLAPLESCHFFPAPVSQPSSRPLHISSSSQLFSSTWASHLQYHPSNPFLHQAGVIQYVKSCSFPAQNCFMISRYP